MAQYYIHKVGSQEMGSIGEDGKPKRGRYFFISKGVGDFFPHLSAVVMNDKAFINIVPLRKDEELKKIVCTIDYHNSKYSDIENTAANKRNETRLYMNKEIDPNLYFEVDDIVVFQKIIDNSNPENTVFTLSRFNKSDEEYSDISKILESNLLNRLGFHALYNDTISYIETPNLSDIEVDVSENAIELGEKETTSILNIKDESQEKETEEGTMGASIFNSVLFRDFVMNAYEYKCAITGKVIKYGNLFNLEAAHIKPQAHSGTFLPCNGIAMSRDMHFAFDKGFFTINEKMEVVVHENLEKTDFYKEYNNKKIFLPKIDYFKPNLKFLKYHKDNIFGTFKQIRKTNL